MTHRILPAAGHRRMPWKNGRGETVEIAVHPQGAGLDDFSWRVSMAGVTEDGDFSIFAGIDRTLAVLTGAGIDLTVQGQAPRRLTPATAPLAFAADRPTAARLLDGPITDLNVMTRRGAFRHRLLAAHDPAGAMPELVGAGPDWVLVLATLGGASCQVAGRTHRLAPFDALLCSGRDAPIPRVAPGAPGVWRIEIFRDLPA